MAFYLTTVPKLHVQYNDKRKAYCERGTVKDV